MQYTHDMYLVINALLHCIVSCSGLYSAKYDCEGDGAFAGSLNIQLSYAEAVPFIGTYFVSGDSWILPLPYAGF